MKYGTISRKLRGIQERLNVVIVNIVSKNNAFSQTRFVSA